MMRSKFNKWTLKAGFALVGALLVLSGCSQSPVSVEPEEAQPVLLTRSPQALSGPQFVPMDEYRTEKLISTKDGGVLQLCDVTLEIPPDAVKNDALFSINIPDINVFYNEFGEDGLQFKVPVKVTMSYREANLANVKEETIRIAFYNESTEKFEDIDCQVDFKDKTVTALLYHFSAYGLISD